MEVTSQERSLDHVKDFVKELDDTFIETAIFNLFKLDILNFIHIKAILAKEFHIQPSEIDKMPAWEYELFMREINNAVKEDNERNKQEIDKAGIKDAQKMSDPKYMQKMQKQSMPKMGNFKIPAIPKM